MVQFIDGRRADGQWVNIIDLGTDMGLSKDKLCWGRWVPRLFGFKWLCCTVSQGQTSCFHFHRLDLHDMVWGDTIMIFYFIFLLPSGTIPTWVTVARKVENKKADELYTLGCEYRKSWKKKICKKSDKWPKMAPVQSMLPLELPRHLNAVIGMHLRWTKYRTCCAYWNGCACVWLGNPTWSLRMTLAYIKCFAEMKPTPEKKSYATRHRWSDILCATFYLISC